MSFEACGLHERLHAERLDRCDESNLKTLLSSFCQSMFFHSTVAISGSVLDVFITTCSSIFQIIVSLSAYPSHYKRALASDSILPTYIIRLAPTQLSTLLRDIGGLIRS